MNATYLEAVKRAQVEHMARCEDCMTGAECGIAIARQKSIEHMEARANA